MELPNYRIPATKNVMQIIGEQVEDFISRQMKKTVTRFEFD
jgi:Fe2+ transport system protein B